MADQDKVALALQRIEAGKNAWGRTHGKMKTTDAAYNLEYSMKRPRGVPLHVPSTAASIVDHARDQVLVSHIITDVEPPGQGSAANKRAQLIKAAADKFTDYLMESAEVALPRQYLHDAILRGAVCTKAIVSDEWKIGR